MRHPGSADDAYAFPPTPSRTVRPDPLNKPLRTEAPPTSHITVASLLPVAVLTLVWGCNWPILKMGVAELPPLTFRSMTLPFAAIGLLAAARLSGDSVRIPRALWLK